MPVKAPSFCKHSGCGQLVRSAYCDEHQAVADLRKKKGQIDYNSRRADSDRRYSTEKWRKLSITFRKRNPLCANCDANGLVRPAALVDHIKAAKSHPELFYEWRNLRALCQQCHNQIGMKVLSAQGEGRVRSLGASSLPYIMRCDYV
jgi:5-methylcytosine-specific restriction protein A